jgi:hypothetical protein
MDRLLDLALAFAKDNGVGVSIPITFYLVFKVWREENIERKAAGEKNTNEIHTLQLQVARLEESIKSIKETIH